MASATEIWALRSDKCSTVAILAGKLLVGIDITNGSGKLEDLSIVNFNRLPLLVSVHMFRPRYYFTVPKLQYGPHIAPRSPI